MPPKVVAAHRLAVQSNPSFSALALRIPLLIAAAFLTALLVAKLEASAYDPGAVQPDAESVYETMAVSP
jgi:hypothetical protein